MISQKEVKKEAVNFAKDELKDAAEGHYPIKCVNTIFS